MHTQTTHQLAERLVYTDDKIDLAYGFRVLMEAADSYCSYDAVDARLSVPEDERLGSDEAATCDARYGSCGDPRVILRELMNVRRRANPRTGQRAEGGAATGDDRGIVELNAAQPPKIVKVGGTEALEPSE